MTRAELAQLSRNEESWRAEMLWRMDNLTWTIRQLHVEQKELGEVVRTVARVLSAPSRAR